MKEFDAVIRRVGQLRQLHSYRDAEKQMIRALCSGPEEGLKALLGDLGDVSPYSVPAANLVLSGLTRLAQKIGRAPDLRVDPPMAKETERARKAAEKRARIVAAYDENDNLDALLNQSGMWLPGYAFTAWVVKEAITEDGVKYGGVTNLDPFGTYPGQSVAGGQPHDLAYVYSMSARDLAEKYPQHRTALIGKGMSAGGVLLDSGTYPVQTANTWTVGSSPHKSGIEVVEYYDRDGCWVVVPEKNLLLERYDNPLSTPQFVVMQKYSFDRPVGQYDHVIGIQATIAQFNSLAVIAMKDATFVETNVRGELLSGQYRKGRHAVNYFTPGTQIDKPQNSLPYQLFQELDRLERQFRTTAGYSVTDDAVSPAAQATGQGIDRLNAGIDMEVKQYLGIMRRGIELIDRKRLEWDDKCYPNESKSLVGTRGGVPFAETYTPGRDINGQYRTVRNYGAMAGLDDQNKISAFLLMRQGGLLDSQTILEEMDLGGRSVTQVQQRVAAEAAESKLMEAMVSGVPMDPRVAMTLIELMPEGERKEKMRTFWTPDGPEMSPEQEAMANMPPPGSEGPPDIMAMLGMGGGAPGGMPPEMAGAMPPGMVA